ncbi:MAG: molybdopterin molybdotransferase MoeA [Balneolaceae bacterium]|nr:molybdopterin molybdotransferase MoeA [Balneolaceae bacterium]MCH8547826.1 molybdopterin molybdotransferase MoeA [Balneolaceae bacterium]
MKNREYISVDDALKIIRSESRPHSKSESVPVKESLSRVLAEELPAQRDVPRFDNSAMDGFLFLHSDLKSGVRSFSIMGEIRPENNNPKTLKAGSCSRIMTGAAVPEGDYFVVPVELTKEDGDTVTVQELPSRNPIRRKGEGYAVGRPVLQKGTVITPYELGLMIESGNKKCPVLKELKVAIQVTGSEIDEDLNSNGPVLKGLLSQWPGLSITELPVLEDDPQVVSNRLKELRDNYDIVLTTGGISMGRHDYILQEMQNLGAEVLIRKIRQKPGKPFTMTRLGDTLFFHLPGNPVSAIFTAEYYVRKAIYNMLGLPQRERKLRSANSLSNHRGEKTLFITGSLQVDSNYNVSVKSDGVMKSHLMQLYRGCDLYIRIDPETEVSPGEPVEVIPFSTTGKL